MVDAAESRSFSPSKLDRWLGWAGYRTFISAPIADRQRTYGMVAVDAPKPGDLLRSDQHLVMLVADLLAIAFASIHEPLAG
jgi:GAF domain-containing protein